MPIDHSTLVEELVEYFLSQGFSVHGAKGMNKYKTPPALSNHGFGDLRPRIPDVVGVDSVRQRIVFGIARETAEELGSESSLTDYNVYLDHKEASGPQASVLVVLLPSALIPDFTTILTHNIHREYWHRVVPVASKVLNNGSREATE